MSEVEVLNDAKAVASAPAGAAPLALEVRGISKRFCRDLKRSLFYGVQDICRELAGRPARTGQLKEHEFWALHHVDFDVPRGTAMGLVGMNGCGKTTLMRILSGLIKPTTGEVKVRGRLAPLLALGAGFNQVLTGRENIYTNMTILGLTREEIDERFDDVVEFSEVGYALDAPVQNFSSGMVARLGFACAIHSQPDVLLLDEVLAVGDLRFRQKCIDAIHEIRGKGASFFVVHHSPDILGALCDTAMYLIEGRLEMMGGARDVLARYADDVRRKGATVRGASRETTDAIGFHVDPDIESENGRILGIEVRGEDVARDGGLVINNEAPSEIAFTLRVDKDIRQLNAVIEMMKLPTLDTLAHATEEVAMAKFSARRDTRRMSDVTPGDYAFKVEFPWLALLPGTYQARVSIYTKRILVARARGERFEIRPLKPNGLDNRFFQPREWTLDSRIPTRSDEAPSADEDEVID